MVEGGRTREMLACGIPKKDAVERQPAYQASTFTFVEGWLGDGSFEVRKRFI
jgi:hypothetical protein